MAQWHIVTMLENVPWLYCEHGNMATIPFPGSHVYKAKVPTALSCPVLGVAWLVTWVSEPTVTLPSCCKARISLLKNIGLFEYLSYKLMNTLYELVKR
jgi:hypothetical protein